VTDDFAWWRAAVAGEKPLTSPDPECGYFKIRDRRGLNKDLAPIKRPWIACAIWKEDGEFKAERAGTIVSVDSLWPWCAKYPIPYETYAYWHSHERWPEEETVK
jgi:hypothetical protein